MKKEHLLQKYRVIYTARDIGAAERSYTKQRPLKLKALNRMDLMNTLKRALLAKNKQLGVIIEYGDENAQEAAKRENMAEKRHTLMKKLNNILGEDAIHRLYNCLEDHELEEIGKLMSMGRVKLHDGNAIRGFSASEDNDVQHGDWTATGFASK